MNTYYSEIAYVIRHTQSLTINLREILLRLCYVEQAVRLMGKLGLESSPPTYAQIVYKYAVTITRT